MSIESIADIIGLLGTALVVAAYFLMQLNKLDPKGLQFNLMNLAGAVCLILSLVVHFNLASFVIEIFWIAAYLVGIYHYIKRKNSE